MAQDRIAALHFLITAQVSGAIGDMDKFAQHAKTLGPALAGIFKQATNELTIYDKELEKLIRKVGRGAGTPTDMARLQQLQGFYESRQSPAPSFPSVAGGMSPSQLAQQQNHDREQAMIAQRMQVAQATADLYTRTQPPQQYGPPYDRDAAEKQRQSKQDATDYNNWLRTRASGPAQSDIQQGLQQTQNHDENSAYQNWLRTRASGPSQSDIRAGMQNNWQHDDYQRQLAAKYNAMNHSYRMQGTPTNFSAGTGPETYEELRNRVTNPNNFQSHLGRNIQTAQNWNNFMGAVPVNNNYSPTRSQNQTGNFAANLRGMNENQLTALIRKFREIEAAGGNVKKQIDAVSNALMDMNRKQDAAAAATGRATNQLNSQARAVRSAGGGMDGTGRGSSARQFRYATQNLAYGVEDAMVSYGLGGTKAAFRAAGNNVSAIASMIPHPGVAAGAIVGTAIATTVAPALIDYIAQANQGRDETEKLTESIKRMFSEAEAHDKIADIIGSGDFDKIDSALKDTTENVSDLQREVDALNDKRRQQNKIMKDNAHAGTSRSYDWQDVGSTLTLGFFGNNRESSDYGRSWMAGLDRVGGDGKYAKSREDYMTAQKNKDEINKVAKEKEAELVLAKEAQEKLNNAQVVARRKKDLGNNLEAMQDDFYHKINREQAQRGTEFTPEEFHKRQQELFKRMDQAIENVATFRDALMMDPQNQAKIRALHDDVRGKYAKDKRGTAFEEEYEDKKKAELKKDKASADRLQEQLVKEMNPRGAIQVEYAGRRDEIRKNTSLSDRQKNMLVGLTNAAEQKALDEFDRPKNTKPTNVGMEVGSREDAEFKQRFMSKFADQKDIAKLNENQLEQLKTVNTNLVKVTEAVKKKPPVAKMK